MHLLLRSISEPLNSGSSRMVFDCARMTAFTPGVGGGRELAACVSHRRERDGVDRSCDWRDAFL